MTKRIMVTGPTGCGKTALVAALEGGQHTPRKCPDILYGKRTMDVPAAYIENAWMHEYLISAAQNASHILFLLDSSHNRGIVYPPGFAGVFTCPVIGVATKADLPPAPGALCELRLREAGVKGPIHYVSAQRGTGLAQLNTYLYENTRQKG